MGLHLGATQRLAPHLQRGWRVDLRLTWRWGGRPDAAERMRLLHLDEPEPWAGAWRDPLTDEGWIPSPQIQESP